MRRVDEQGLEKNKKQSIKRMYKLSMNEMSIILIKKAMWQTIVYLIYLLPNAPSH